MNFRYVAAWNGDSQLCEVGHKKISAIRDIVKFLGKPFPCRATPYTELNLQELAQMNGELAILTSGKKLTGND